MLKQYVSSGETLQMVVVTTVLSPSASGGFSGMMLGVMF
jgi:hypothetical protein